MNRTIRFLVRAATNTAFRPVQVRRVAPELPGRHWSEPRWRARRHPHGDRRRAADSSVGPDIIWFPWRHGQRRRDPGVPASGPRGIRVTTRALRGGLGCAVRRRPVGHLSRGGASPSRGWHQSRRTGAARIPLGAWERDRCVDRTNGAALLRHLRAARTRIRTWGTPVRLERTRR